MSEPARAGAAGGPQRIPRPPGVRIGQGAWWSAPTVAPPETVPLRAVRAAFAAPAGADPDLSAEAGTPTPGSAVGGVGDDLLVAAEPGQEFAGGPAGGPSGLEIADSVLDDRLPLRDARPAAVLCALFEEDGDTWVVLTRRSTRLRSHTGEVAFPGGRLDEGETPLQAALREADEEVGIDPAGVEVIGRLSPLATMTSRAAITPVVGILPGRPDLRPSPAEVDRAFTVPLAGLMAPGVYHEELWPFADGSIRRVHFFLLTGETVWGATARMLRELLDRVHPAPS